MGTLPSPWSLPAILTTCRASTFIGKRLERDDHTAFFLFAHAESGVFGHPPRMILAP